MFSAFRSLLIFLVLVAAVPPAPAAIVPGLGCENSVFKARYDDYLTPSQIAVLVAITTLNQTKTMATGSVIVERLRDIATVSNDDKLDFTFLSRFMYPFENRNLIEIDAYPLTAKATFYGRRAIRKNFQVFYEIMGFCRAMRRMDIPSPTSLKKNRPSDDEPLTPPKLHLSDYYILAQFSTGERLGSTEVYERINRSLSYYRYWHPTTPTSVLQRIKKLYELGYVGKMRKDEKNRLNGGSLYQFEILRAGKQALTEFEDYYLRVLAYYMKTTDTVGWLTEK